MAIKIPSLKATVKIAGVTQADIPDSVIQNSDGSYNVSLPPSQPLTVPDSVIKKTNGETIGDDPATKDFIVPDSLIKNTDGDLLISLTATDEFTVGDSSVTNSVGSFTDNIPATKPYNIVDGVINNSDDSWTENVPSKVTVTVPDSVIKNSAGTTIATVPATKSATIADSSITDSDGSVSSLAATIAFVAKTLSQLLSTALASVIYAAVSAAANFVGFIQLLTASDLSNLTSAQVQELTSGQIQELTNTQIGELTSAQVQALTNTQIGYMSAAQVQELVNSQLANLTTGQLQYILASVMGNQFLNDNLSVSQRNSMNEIYTLQTGQTTSYATGDDGDLKLGRLTDFYTLKTNNIFGNTLRFTDYQGNNSSNAPYIIDHATGLGWSTATKGSGRTWNQKLSDVAIFSQIVNGITYNDFHLPNVKEMYSICNLAGTSGGNLLLSGYPFFRNSTEGLVTSTSATGHPNADYLKVFSGGTSSGTVGFALYSVTTDICIYCRIHF